MLRFSSNKYSMLGWFQNHFSCFWTRALSYTNFFQDRIGLSFSPQEELVEPQGVFANLQGSLQGSRVCSSLDSDKIEGSQEGQKQKSQRRFRCSFFQDQQLALKPVSAQVFFFKVFRFSSHISSFKFQVSDFRKQVSLLTIKNALARIACLLCSDAFAFAIANLIACFCLCLCYCYCCALLMLCNCYCLLAHLLDETKRSSKDEPTLRLQKQVTYLWL